MSRENMSLLEQHFDVAFAAPDGIKKLRELILTLAMQGKLVSQDPNDEPASELLKLIELEKQRLVKEGKMIIPLPPLAEQRRIVEKIDRLMGMCDRLEGSIESGKGKQTDLLNALMSQV
jgi:restriction endonuclease S subunit